MLRNRTSTDPQVGKTLPVGENMTHKTLTEQLNEMFAKQASEEVSERRTPAKIDVEEQLLFEIQERQKRLRPSIWKKQ